jgi:hypothetical protein
MSLKAFAPVQPPPPNSETRTAEIARYPFKIKVMMVFENN